MGKRDVSHDLGLPLPRQWFRPGLHTAPQDLGPGVAEHLASGPVDGQVVAILVRQEDAVGRLLHQDAVPGLALAERGGDPLVRRS